MSCPSSETAARWLLHELSEDEAQAFEEHYFGCDACLARVAAVERSRSLLQRTLPTILTPARRQELERGPQAIPAVHVHAGERQLIRLGADAPIGFWVLHADLANAERVDLAVFDETGAPVISLRDVPFDAARGEVVLACQTHYRHLRPGTQIQAELTAHSADEQRAVGRYVLDHEFFATS